MNELKIFENNQFGKVRVQVINNEPWFVAKDVCDALDIKNSRQALTRLEEDEKADVILNDGSQNRNMSIVNEYGLYNLVLASRKQEAKQFKRWITHEVIPTIRKHGAYLTEDKIKEVLLNPDTIIKLAMNLKQEKKRRLQLQETIEKNKPKVLFANSVETSKTSILVGELAKIMKQNGHEIGQNRLFEWLRNNNYLISRKGTDYNMPTQKSMNLGLFEIKETSITHADGHITVNKTPKITGKGQIYFMNKISLAD